MPELPEVERYRRLLLPLISTIPLSVELMNDNPPKKFLTSDDILELSGKCFVKDVLRKGKLIAVLLSCPREIRNQQTLYLFVHMGMTGRISTPDHVSALESLATSDYPPPHTHLKFKTGTAEACFSDPRKFGFVTLGTSLEEGFGTLATDALEFDTPGDLMGKSTGIKAILLDQKRILSGVGNWIADEVLYQCEIHPEQCYLSEEQAKSILQNLRSILTTAIDQYGKDESFPSDWLFHVRWDKRASTKGGIIKDCRGRKVTFLTAAGRTSAIVPSIQKNLKSQKPIKSEKGKKRPLEDLSSIDASDKLKSKIANAKRMTPGRNNPVNENPKGATRKRTPKRPTKTTIKKTYKKEKGSGGENAGAEN